jgi:hypothetical protein
MSDERFSPDVKDALVAAGWAEGRSVPELVEGWRAAHVPRPICSSVRTALLEFGGLRGNHPAPAETYRDNQSGTFALDPNDCKLDHAAMEELAARAGESGVYPLGVMYSGAVKLAMGDSGCVFGVGKERKTCVGRSIDEAMAGIVRGELGFEI